MIRIPEKGERLVYTKPSKFIKQDFNGYSSLKVGTVYTVEKCTRISEYKAVDDSDNWYISLVNVGVYGYALDCFEPLSDIRKDKLNQLLD
jgi:hypothetical protein